MILVFNKHFLSESITVNTRTLTYLGYNEDSQEGFCSRPTEKNNHGPVLMVRSLADSIHHSNKVFASNIY